MSNPIKPGPARPASTSTHIPAGPIDTKARTTSAFTSGTPQQGRIPSGGASLSRTAPLQLSGWADPSRYLSFTQLNKSRQGDKLTVTWQNESNSRSFNAEVEGITPRPDGGFDLHLQAELPDTRTGKPVRSPLRLPIHPDTFESDGPRVLRQSRGSIFKRSKPLAPQDGLFQLLTRPDMFHELRGIVSEFHSFTVQQVKEAGFKKQESVDWGAQMALECSPSHPSANLFAGRVFLCVAVAREWHPAEKNWSVTLRMDNEPPPGLGHTRRAPDGRGFLVTVHERAANF